MTELEHVGHAGVPDVPETVPPELVRLTAAWLLAQRSIHTRTAYRRDVTEAPPRMKIPGWLPWCAHNLDPLFATRGHVDAYARQLEGAGSSPATVARKLSAISSWYDYLCDEEVTDRNPARKATRPDIDRDVSNAVGLTEAEASALIAEADEEGPLASAVVRIMLLCGVRVNAIVAARWRDFGYNAGHRVIRYVLKGGKIKKAPLAPPAAQALDAWSKHRGEPEPDERVFTILVETEDGEAVSSCWSTSRTFTGW